MLKIKPLKIFSHGLTISLHLLVGQAWAQSSMSGLKSNESYVTDISRISNTATYQGNIAIRKGLKGEPFTIPKDWRLISVVPDRTRDGSSEYVLFFQDSHSSVHTVGLTSSGLLSGNNLLLIPAVGSTAGQTSE